MVLAVSEDKVAFEETSSKISGEDATMLFDTAVGNWAAGSDDIDFSSLFSSSSILSSSCSRDSH